MILSLLADPVQSCKAGAGRLGAARQLRAAHAMLCKQPLAEAVLVHAASVPLRGGLSSP